MFWQVVLHTPLWVWPLFLALLALGFSQSRDRIVPGPLVLALPVIMVAYSAYGVIATFGMQPRALTAWCAGILTTIALNQGVFHLPGGVIRDPAAWRFTIRGSLLPLALIMAIFWTRYGLGILAAMSPTTIADPVFTIVMSYWLGLCSGFFPARTIRIFSATPA